MKNVPETCTYNHVPCNMNSNETLLRMKDEERAILTRQELKRKLLHITNEKKVILTNQDYFNVSAIKIITFTHQQ